MEINNGKQIEWLRFTIDGWLKNVNFYLWMRTLFHIVISLGILLLVASTQNCSGWLSVGRQIDL